MKLGQKLAQFGYESRCLIGVTGVGLRGLWRLRTGAFAEALSRLAMTALGLVAIAHFFAGMVIVLQSASQLGQYGSNHLAGDIIALALVRELAPLFTALLMAGKAGAGLASHLGMLTLSGQTQAMRALSIDVNREIVAPQWLAVVVGTLLLTIAAIITGLLGGMMLADANLGVSGVQFVNRAISALGPEDFACGLIKAIAFGAIIASTGTVYGLKATHDAADLGRHTMRTVIASSFVILISDHVLTSFVVAVWE